MFRIKIFTYLVRKRLSNNLTLIQNGIKLNKTIRCQCMSSVNIQEFGRPDLYPKETTSEETAGEPSGSKNLTDKEFLVHLKNDPDRFGQPQEEEFMDEGDIQEEKYFTEQPSPSQKLRTKQYADIIKNLIRQHKIKEAIDVVEIRMLKEDRVKPENYLYNLLLGACGRVGYTQKAFNLYNRMKQRALQATGGTYTALFNACANSPWPTTDGLKRATHLRNIMIEKGYEPNDTNYNVMIKAFGRCGDLPMAFSLVDEMSSKGFKIKDDTINFLLQACISDKEAGFRHALLVWRKLIKKNILPSVYTYNLMLRCIRDCGLGDIEVTQDVINKILSDSNESSQKTIEDGHRKSLEIENNGAATAQIDYNITNSSIQNLYENGKANVDDNVGTAIPLQISVQSNTLEKKGIKDIRPNLMAKVPHLGSLISLSEIKKPEERLLLVGGCSGFLENMKENQCTPDVKTFTQLLDNTPSTLASENELLTAMKKFCIKPDIDFYNMLIKKRSLRHDFENAREVLVLMNKLKYKPNLITYGVLALSCKNKEEALSLIEEMESKSYRLNIEILGAMLHQACHHMNFSYIFEVMEKCIKDNIQPSTKFMNTLDEFVKKCKKLLNSKKLTRSEEKKFGILKARYKTWTQEVEVDETQDVHPWQQYKEANEQDGQYHKWKDGVRFKPRHKSLFRVKTLKKN